MNDGEVAKVVHSGLERCFSGRRELLDVELERLRGGLESGCVVRVLGLQRPDGGAPRRVTLVAKHLERWRVREALIYRALARSGLRLAPRWLGVAPCAGDGTLLLLEFVERREQWPWREVGAIVSVLARLAELHRAAGLGVAFVRDGWDYEAELLAAAARTSEEVERPAPVGLDSMLRGIRPALRRFVGGLTGLRRTLLGSRRFGRAALHGDVHTGNVIMVDAAAGPEILLIDWSRARCGSPLEDVSSMTESLGLWEPEARRRHDTLIRAYLGAHGGLGELDAELRAHYWLAAASNVLAGALAYHLATMRSSLPSSRTFEESHRAARAALRVVRCAVGYWC